MIAANSGKRHRNSTASEDAQDRERGSSAARSPPQDPIVIVIPPAQNSARKLLVYPRTPDLIIPEGATILRSTDNKWVGVAMTLAEEEYEGYNN